MRAVQTPAGFRELGLETIPPLVRRGVLAELVRSAGEPVADGHLVRLSEFERAVDSFGVEIREGDVVLIRTGNGARWADAPAYMAGPGVSTEVSRALAERAVAAVGVDNVAWDLPGYRDPELGCTLPGHVVLIVEHGTYIIENLLPEDLGALAVTEFVFVCLPLKLRGGTGCPVRPIALVTH